MEPVTACYHSVPSYVSNHGQVTKPGGYLIEEANPRGLGPPPPNAYKRAVLRDPPKRFKISVLPPKKLGSAWAYGLHVVSAASAEAADRRSISSSSASSGSSWNDYKVWRRWDDCLWFQETLELEYSIQAREKRRRLEQGKGVKKNGVYLNSKEAASFDSLPPGPDPTSVSLDIHDYVPKLSKKSTLFRANQATIDQRQQQFTSLIDALFAPEVPTLIEELRASRTIKDFFGWWRRDKDFALKHGPEKGKSPEVPILDSVPFYLDTSSSSQIFSTPSTPFRDPRSKPTRPSTADASTSDSKWRSLHTRSRDDVSSRRRRTTPATRTSPAIAISSASINDLHESRPSSRGSQYSDELSPTMVMWDGHEQLNASDRISPHALLNAFPQTPMVKETFENIQCPPSPEADSPVLGLEALPEGSELELPLPRVSVHEYEPETRPPVTRSRGNSASDSRHRNAIVFSPHMMLGDAEIPEMPDLSPTTTNTATTSSRHSSLFSNVSFAPSWRTSTSDLPPCPSPRRSLDSYTTDAFDYFSTGSPVMPLTPGLPDSEAFPIPGPSLKWNPRESIMSINSIMSNSSVDQVLPRGVHITPQSGDFSAVRSFLASPRSRPQKFVPMSVPEEEVFPEDCDDGILESYLYGIEEMDTSGESESEGHNPYRERSSRRQTSKQLPKPFQDRRPEQFHLPWTPTSPTTPRSPSNREGTSKVPTNRISMASTSTVSLRTISIKTYLTGGAIIVFRIAAETTYSEIRDKIYDKFVNQEGIALRPDFSLACLAPTLSRHSTSNSVYSRIARKRTVSVGSASTESSLFPIQTQEDWDEAVRGSDGKLTLSVSE